jgi:FkbM family methyltransferase
MTQARIPEKLLVWYARHFPVRRGKIRMVNALWRAVGQPDTRRIAVLEHGGFRMTCDLAEMLQRQFYFFGTYFLEQDILSCWQVAARDARVVLDVGANAGVYSLAALAVRRSIQVHAFEPTPEIAARLRATAALNGLDELCVHEMAVSSRSGEATLVRFRGELGNNEGMNFISSAAAAAGAGKVKTVCLDEFCKIHGLDHVDLLKLDIQGHEHMALAGAERLIQAGRIATIFAELNWSEDNPSNCPAAACIRLLDAAGYHFAKPETSPVWRRAGDWLRTMSDVIATSPQGAAGSLLQ